MGFKVCVVGGGPAGLLFSYVLASLGFEVSVFEEHKEVGVPRHCSGMISDYVISSLHSFVKDSVINKFKNYVLVLDTISNLEEAFTINFDEYVYAVDRERLEKNVFEALKSLNVDVRLKSKVVWVSSNPLRTVLESGNNEVCDYVIVGEGAIRRFSKSLGFCKSVNNAYGLQAIVKVSKVLEVPYVILSRFFDSDSFGWIIPLEDKEVLVGVIAKNYLKYRLTYLLKKFSRYEGLLGYSLIKVFGGLIPLDKPCNVVLKERNIIVTGDAASMIKPISKGGLYPIALSLHALKKSIRRGKIDLKLYFENLKPIINKLKTQHIIKDVAVRFGGYYNLVRLVKELGVKELKISKYDDLILRGMSFISKQQLLN